MNQQKKLKWLDFVAMFLRSFFIQSAWNYKGLLSVGFCNTIIPVARRLYTKKEEYASFMKRHLNFFNSHPYMASYAVGAIARLEEDLANNPESNIERIDKFKNALIGPLGAVGDHLFWATFKPAVSVMAMAGVLIIQNIETKLLFLLVLLILYNVPHLYVRWIGIREGYTQGYNVYKYLRIEHFARFEKVYTFIGAISLGLFCGFYFSSELNSKGAGVLVFLISLGLAVYVRTQKTMVYRTMLIPLIVSLIIGILVAVL